MKCTNCGKNNAVNHYRYEVNGKVTEAHLCADCARELQPEREFAARSREMFGDMFSDSFFGESLFDRRPMGGLLESFFGRDPFESFLSPFTMLGAPRIEIRFPEAEKNAADGVKEDTNAQVDPELSKKRRINALREQMKKAAEEENYEEAAKLRDELRKAESQE